MIGFANGLFVVLDHHHGVADVAHALERLEQSLIVTLMQADGWLVQYVDHTREVGADLAR